MNSLESVWEYREEVLYPQLFGSNASGICVLTPEIFIDVFKQESFDPRWTHLGVQEFSPTASRPTWLYATSGGSTPWNVEPPEYNPDDYSWLGFELVMEAPTQAPWAVNILLRLLAYNVLICHGRYGDIDPLDYGHRIPLGGPVMPGSSITHVMLAEPEHYPVTHTLASGKFDFLHAVGITTQERDYAKEHSSNELLALLKQRGAFPLTEPLRASVV